MNKNLYITILILGAIVLLLKMANGIDFTLSFNEFIDSGILIIGMITATVGLYGYYISNKNRNKDKR